MFIILSSSDRFFGKMFSEIFGFQPAGGQFRMFFGRILGADFRIIRAGGVNSEHVLGAFFLKFRGLAVARAKSADFRRFLGSFFS